MKTNNNKFGVIWFFLKDNLGIYGGIFVITLGYAVLESVNISVFFPVFRSILKQESSPGGIFLYLDRVIGLLPFKDQFVSACVLVIAVLVLKEVLAFGRTAMIGYGVGKVVCDVRERVFQKYVEADYNFFLQNKQGDLLYKTLTAPGRLGACLQYIPDLVTAILMTITIGFLLTSISVPVTISILAAALCFNLLTRYLARKVSYNIGYERAEVSARATVILNEFIDGVKQIKTSSSVDRWNDKFKEQVRRFKTLVIEDIIWLAIPERLFQMLPAVMIIGVLLFFYAYFGETSKDSLVTNLPLIAVYAFGFYRLVPYITSFGRLRMQIMGLLPDIEMIYELLTSRVERSDPGKHVLRGFDRAIHFERVNFNYMKGHDVLKNISFSIGKGSSVAIVGPSGSGKTTLVNILLRLFEPSEGKVTIDDIDINQIEYSSLTKRIALVCQETFIFNGSVRENIEFGLRGVSFDRILEAAQSANAHDFILSLPGGYETIVGDKGMKVSGGQRQRLAIARAVLRNPDVLVLDEATSSLDHDSEIIVQRAINAISKDRTVIVIAHRLSSIVGMDKIVVLNDGEIVAEGTHDYLMKKDDTYRALYLSQSNMTNHLNEVVRPTGSN